MKSLFCEKSGKTGKSTFCGINRFIQCARIVKICCEDMIIVLSPVKTNGKSKQI